MVVFILIIIFIALATCTFEETILSAINAVRAQKKNPPAKAGSIKPLTWNAGLAKLAAEWAEKCNFSHNYLNVKLAPFSYIGQNIFGGPSTNGANAVSAWAAEKEKYTYTTISSTNYLKTGHYTQLIWSGTTQVGCATKTCKGLVNFPEGTGITVCNFGQGGNYQNEYPYPKSSAATTLEEDSLEDEEMY